MMNIGVPLTRVLAAKITSARITLDTRSSATHRSYAAAGTPASRA